MSELTRFQDAFTAALSGDDAALHPWGAEPAGISVYRNTVAKGCADALVANFPAVAKVTGEAWLAAAAVRHAADQPPAKASLLDHGAGFAAWLEGFAPAADMPFLSGLARLDRAWVEAHLAPDAAPVEAAAFEGLTAEDFPRLTAALHPSARLLAFKDGLAGLWLALRDETAPDALELEDAPSAILILRPRLTVETLSLSAGGLAFLAACRAGGSLSSAAEAALSAEPCLALADLFATLISAGAFAGLMEVQS